MVLLTSSTSVLSSIINNIQLCNGCGHRKDSSMFIKKCVYLNCVHLMIAVVVTLSVSSHTAFARNLKYVWGDALENPEALGPGGESYPW